jgi:hypothetical protein
MAAILEFVVPFNFMVFKKQANNYSWVYPASVLQTSNPTADQLHKRTDPLQQTLNKISSEKEIF